MSLAGFKKQLNKANQYMSEKIGGAEGTKYSPEFLQMENKTDLMDEVVEEMLNKTKEYLQPNPAIRAKMVINSKVNGPNTERYPHPEQGLGECMTKYGHLWGKTSSFGQSLIQMGETLKELTEIRHSLEDTIRQNFLKPLTRLQAKELKDCMYHRRKLEGRRLDYDCKRRQKLKGFHVLETDMKSSEDKFNESYKLASVAMEQLIDSDKEQVAKLTALSEALYDYHNQCANILKSLTTRIKRKNENNKETVVSLSTLCESAWDSTTGAINQYNSVKGLMKLNGQLNNISQTSNPLLKSSNISKTTHSVVNPFPKWEAIEGIPTKKQKQPICRALYDFQPENDSELCFKEGNVIQLRQQIDDNWFEGSIDGRNGLFPISYVEVLVPLKH